MGVQRISAHEALQWVADPGSFRSWDLRITLRDGHLSEYGMSLARAAEQTGSDESVVTGECAIGGVPAAVIAWEFGFLGGSVGIRTATRIVAAIRRATARGLPLVALPRSGGTRMQEGSPAFVQMVAITGALVSHRAAGLPFLVHLCGPTTGGVLATIGSAGDVTTAEPGAMVGFLGPRAYHAITGERFPDGVQTAGNLLEHGIVDAVLAWDRLPHFWSDVLGLWADRPVTSSRPQNDGAAGARPGPVPGAPESPAQLWNYVEASREPGRPDASQLIAAHMTDVVSLPGTSEGQVCRGAVVALGRLRGLPVVLAATEDRRTGEPLTVGGLRTMRRGIALAGRWGLPIVTIVDTLGAQLSVEGEQSGIAGEISRLMLDLVGSPSPSTGLLLGAGTGGAALAMLACDRIVAGSHTWVAPLAPEGAAAIRHDGSHDPAQIAWEQRIGAHSLAELGFVDVIVRESEPDWLATAASEVIAQVSAVIDGVQPSRRVERFAAWASDG